MSDYKRKPYSEQKHKPKCDICNVACKSITERMKRTLLMDSNKGLPYVPVIYSDDKLTTQLFICPNKDCRRVYTEDGKLFAGRVI